VLIILYRGEGPRRSPPDDPAGPARTRPDVYNPFLPLLPSPSHSNHAVNNVRCRGDVRFCRQRYPRMLLLLLLLSLLLLLLLRFTYYYYYTPPYYNTCELYRPIVRRGIIRTCFRSDKIPLQIRHIGIILYYNTSVEHYSV